MNSQHSIIQTVLALILAMPILPGLAADEWPQFRGPDGQGQTAAAELPLTWSETENIKWKFPDPGEGWSSPVIAAGKVWMTTATANGTSLRVVGVDLESGKLLNDIEVFHREKPMERNPMNSHASPSPVIEAGRLYVSFGSTGTACLSTETGTILWQRQDLVIDHAVGPASSPVLAQDKLVILFDGKDLQFVVALDKQTGKTLWKTDRSFVNGKKPNPSHALGTPLVVRVNGIDQVLAPGAQRTFAYDLATGKELWWVTHNGWSQVPRPLYGNGLFYTTTGYGSANSSALLAIRPDGHGDVTESQQVVWRMVKQVPMMPSPVLVDKWLFAVNDDGMMYCLDALTGTDAWREKIGGKYSASLLAAPGRIYCFDRDGTATVVAATDKFTVLAKNKLDSGCMASAAVAGKSLILRTRKTLYRIEK